MQGLRATVVLEVTRCFVRMALGNLVYVGVCGVGNPPVGRMVRRDSLWRPLLLLEYVLSGIKTIHPLLLLREAKTNTPKTQNGSFPNNSHFPYKAIKKEHF